MASCQLADTPLQATHELATGKVACDNKVDLLLLEELRHAVLITSCKRSHGEGAEGDEGVK